MVVGVDQVVPFGVEAVPPSIFGGSPRTLPTGADEAGGTAVKFYKLRDNLSRKICAPRELFTLTRSVSTDW